MMIFFLPFFFFKQHVKHVLAETRVEHVFLVGGFAESPIVQEALRQEFKARKLRVIIPQVRKKKIRTL